MNRFLATQEPPAGPGEQQRFVLATSGPSGSGKSSTVEYWLRKFGIPVVPKVGDSMPRHDQHVTGPGDTRTLSVAEVDRLIAMPESIWYRYGAWRKVFSCATVRRLLATHRVVSLIHGHESVPEQLACRLDPDVSVAWVYIDTRPEIIIERLRAAGYTEEQLRARTERSHQNEEHYHRRPERYHVIDNNGDRHGFELQLTALVSALLQTSAQSCRN